MPETSQYGKLTLRGRGTVHASPDTAEIGLTIESRGDSPAEASSKAEENIEEVKEALKRACAPVKGLKTISFEVVPFFETVIENNVQTRKQNGYVARHEGNIEIPVKNGAHLKVISTISKMCPDARTSLTFKLKNTASAESDSLKLAAKSALNDARILAKSLNVRIVGISSVVKDQLDSVTLRPRPLRAVALSNTPDIEPTEFDISAEVTVTFDIQPIEG